MKMKYLLLALASLHLSNAVDTGAALALLAKQRECRHPKMPGFHAVFPDPLGLPCDMQAIEDARHTDEGFFKMIGYFVGLVYFFSALHILTEFFWKPSWNALISFFGLGATAQEMNSDHFSTFANCIKQFYLAVIATLLTRSTIGISILIGSCVIEVWIIAGMAVLFNPDGANLGIVGFDLFKDVLFHAGSIVGFFFFTGFMEPPEAILKQAQAAALNAAGNADATAALGSIDVAEWFLVLGLFALWLIYTLIVFMENTCCHSCLASGESEDDQAVKSRVEAKAGESIRGGAIDEENKYPDVATPQEQSPDAVDATLALDNGDIAEGLQAELARAKSTSLWTPPDSILGKIKYFLTLPFWVLFTFTIPNFRDSDAPGHYREVEWTDIFRVIVANALANFWMAFFAIIVVQWGCIIGAVLDFEYEVVGLVILAVGASFDNLFNAMYCTWSDADTAYQLSEGFAAQVNNWTFTLGFIMSIYMIQEGEQMPVYDGIRLTMVLLGGAAVCLFLFLRLRGMEATPVLGCLMVEFGVLVATILVWLVHEKPDIHLTWN